MYASIPSSQIKQRDSKASYNSTPVDSCMWLCIFWRYTDFL